jgi:hypothetical protein
MTQRLRFAVLVTMGLVLLGVGNARRDNKNTYEQEARQKPLDDFDAKQRERQAKVDRTSEKQKQQDAETAAQLKALLDDFDAKQRERQAKIDRTIEELEAIRNKNEELRDDWNDPGFLAPFYPNGRPIPAPAIPPNLRGEVTQVAGDLLALNIGTDAGLGVGSVLDINRLDGEGRYLGTVKVTSALNLFPKKAFATFIPARNVPLDRMKPEDLPRKGDEVRPPGALTDNK